MEEARAGVGCYLIRSAISVFRPDKRVSRLLGARICVRKRFQGESSTLEGGTAPS